MNMDKNKLIAIHDEVSREINSTNVTNDLMKLTEKEFLVYQELIRSFFTGKEDEIKSIYDSIKNNDYPYNKIQDIDIAYAENTYSQYLEGLMEFVNVTTKLKDTDTVPVDKVRDTINTVANKDKSMLSSLFGGDMNPVIDMSIDVAMKNIEVLINIDGDFSKSIDGCNSVLVPLRLSGIPDTYHNEIFDAVKILFESLRTYNFKCICTIFDTFEKIHDSIQTRTPVNGVVEKPKYQLF